MDEWGPEKIVCVHDTRTGMRGVLVIDNTSRGMGKGGTRMSSSVTVAETARLARVMTWKWAGVDLFFGGAKAGIRCDPSASNREEVLRTWARCLSNEIPSEYVVGLDMGLTEVDAAIVQDELRDRGAAVGSPHELGGVPYDELGVTGFGVAEAADAAADVIGLDLNGARVVIQGFGAVGHAAAQRLSDYGAIIVAVSTVEGVIHNPDGLDVKTLLDARAEYGEALISHIEDGKRLEAGSELLLSTDVLVPAACQDVIDEATAQEIDARLIVEGANLPTSSAAQEILRLRGIPVVPDFIANAGGVVAAGFAMDARYSAFRPDAEEIFTTIAEKLRTNTQLVLEQAAAREISPHAAALGVAQGRVRTAMELKRRIG
ncbi:MAG: Glu/Leu/Phe/Val dehydrogenase dimerization domain-containing protein [Bacteroidota bacterium]